MFYSSKGRAVRTMANLRQSGPVVRITPTWVDTMNPEDALTIHRIKNEFPKSPWYNPTDVRNVFSIEDVDVHRRWRRLLSHPLSESALKDVLSQVESNVRFAIDQIGREMETRGVADVYKWWMCLASDVIGELTFGESFGMLHKGEASRALISRCIIPSG